MTLTAPDVAQEPTEPPTSVPAAQYRALVISGALASALLIIAGVSQGSATVVTTVLGLALESLCKTTVLPGEFVVPPEIEDEAASMALTALQTAGG